MLHATPTAALLWLALTLSTGANAAVESVTTPAGHRFLFSEMDGTNRVAFQVTWPSSWLKEEGRNPAVAYLGVELMTRSGAGDMDASELLERFRDLDARARVWVTSDAVRAALDVDDEHLDEALEVARSVIARPRFDEGWMVRIRDGMHGRWKQSRALLANRGWDAVRRAVLGTQPINSALSLSEIEALEEVTRDDLLAWHARTIVAEGAHIVVAGGLSRRRVFGALPTGTHEAAIPIDADFSPRTILLHVPDAEKSMIGFAGQLPTRAHGGEYEDLIAVLVLAAGAGSRIFDAVRTQHRASYKFGAELTSYTRDVRFLAIGGEVEEDKLASARDLVLETYSRFREEGPTTKEVATAKARLRRAVGANLRKPGVYANVVMESVLDGTSAQRVSGLESELEAISPRMIRERLQQAFPEPEDLIQVIVSPNRDAVEDACVVRTVAEVDHCSDSS